MRKWKKQGEWNVNTAAPGVTLYSLRVFTSGQYGSKLSTPVGLGFSKWRLCLRGLHLKSCLNPLGSGCDSQAPEAPEPSKCWSRLPESSLALILPKCVQKDPIPTRGSTFLSTRIVGTESEPEGLSEQSARNSKQLSYTPYQLSQLRQVSTSTGFTLSEGATQIDVARDTRLQGGPKEAEPNAISSLSTPSSVNVNRIHFVRGGDSDRRRTRNSLARWSKGS